MNLIEVLHLLVDHVQVPEDVRAEAHEAVTAADQPAKAPEGA